MIRDTTPDDPDGADQSVGARYRRYVAQATARGLPCPTWGEWLRSGQPLFTDTEETSP